jgi:hypothetical protein
MNGLFRSRMARATFTNRMEKHDSHAYAGNFIYACHFFHVFQWLR